MNPGTCKAPVAPASAPPNDAADLASTRLADAAALQWRRIDDALAPIIGPRGMAALYRRVLAQATVQHPWLAAAQPTAPPADPYEALQRTLASRPDAQAAAASARLRDGFRDLLAHLIGSALCGRLLRGLEPPPPSGAAAQDSDR